MEALLTEHLILSVGGRIASYIVAIGLGALLCWRFLPITFIFRRGQYALTLAATNLLSTLLLSMSLLLPAAAVLGTIWLVVLAELTIGVVAGAILYAGAAARSRDINGTRRLAWLGLVPLANLYLLFKAPAEPRDSMSGTGIGLIFLAVALTGLGRILDAQITDAITYQSWPRPLVDVVAGVPAAPADPSVTLPERLRLLATEASADLPQELEEALMLVAVQANGSTLTFDLVLEVPNFPPFPPQVLDRVAAELCRDPQVRDEIAAGARVLYRYVRADGFDLGTVAATRETC